MGIQERKNRNKQFLRQSILDAAEKLFIAEGFDRVSMRKIAAEIEYSPTTLYLYFKDKQEIFYHLLQQYYERLAAFMQEIDLNNDDPLVRIQKGMRVYIEFGLSNPNYYKLAFMMTPEIKAEDYLDQSFAGAKVIQSLNNNVEQCLRMNLFRSMKVDLISQIIWSTNHGVTSLLLSNPNFPWVDRDTLIEKSIENVIMGLSI